MKFLNMTDKTNKYRQTEVSAKSDEFSFKTEQEMQNKTRHESCDLYDSLNLSKDGFFIPENGGNLHKIAVIINANGIFLCESH